MMKASEAKLRKVLGLQVPGEGRVNYSVKAGAGGGKTTALSIRITEQIIEGTPIEEFVVITYTNAAAAELREKITSRLQEAVNGGKFSGKMLANAESALNSIELMQISTIHAFLLKILREYAFESGVVLDVNMLETDQDTERKNRFFNQWYHNHYDEVKVFRTDWIHVTDNNSEYDMAYQVLQNMFIDLANIREEIVYDTSDHTADFEKTAAEYINVWLPKLVIFKDELLENRPVKKDKTPKKLNKVPQEIVDEIAAAEGSAAIGIDEACKLSGTLKKIKKILDKGESFYGAAGDNVPILGVIPDIPEVELEWNFVDIYNKYMLPSQKTSNVVDYVCKMQKEYQKELDKETRELSNDDILYRADKLLKEHADILDKLRTRYSKIYVDEFQDTTGLQARIVKMLAEKAGTDPAAEQLEADKLLVVGDPKQSIYRFNGAEKAVYDAVDAMMAAHPSTKAESVSLDTNFRSNSDIVKWVNRSFGQLMPGYSDMETDWQVTEPNALHGVYRYEPEVKLNAQGNPEKYNRKADVEAVADLIQRLVGHEYCFLEECDWKEDGSFGASSLRKIQYSDIMIICKNTNHMDDYVKKFAELGIPVNVQGKFKVSDDVILRNYVLLIEYFSNPKDRKKRIAAAQVICGMDVTRVHADELKNAENKLYEMSGFFREKEMDSAAIAQHLLSREDLFLPKGKTQELEAVRAYRIRLHQMVETCLLKNDADLKKLADLMNEYLENDVKREIPLESNENAIRLMNVHQAKGLTGQIVIIANRTASEACRYSAFKKDGKYYPTARYKISDDSSPNVFPSFGWDMDTMKQAYKDESEEAIRLQYVAATRAAQALIIMPVAYSEPWFTKAEYGYDRLPDVKAWLEEREADSTSYALKARGSGTAHREIRLEDMEANLAAVDLTDLAEKQVTSVTPSGLEPSDVTGYAPQDPGFVKENRPGGSTFGTVMHRVYELMFVRYQALMALAGNEQEALIGRLINQAILEQMEEMKPDDKPQEFADYLKPKMIEYLDKVITPIMDSEEAVYPEYTFSFYVPGAERAAFLADFDRYFKLADKPVEVTAGPIWVNGQADLVVKQKDGSIKVYDYKSDAMNGKPQPVFERSLETKYNGQLSLYRYAIGKAFGVNEVDTELIHLYR